MTEIGRWGSLFPATDFGGAPALRRRTRAVQIDRYFSAELTSENSWERRVPRLPRMVTRAIAINEAIRAYSIAVAPDSLPAKALNWTSIVLLPLRNGPRVVARSSGTRVPPCSSSYAEESPQSITSLSAATNRRRYSRNYTKKYRHDINIPNVLLIARKGSRSFSPPPNLTAFIPPLRSSSAK